ncbi:unnamed protein product [Thlaspi arvense]|uniref:TF-B3 domain-containing protein n=1 Tax=Thlaspi arvense TaxID=13288 RepID=A0AAU9T2Z8_THLAR|nr:unnamed protein product [Thlaspi arvense]
MSSSSLSSRFCFNRECTEFNLKHYRPGWRLQTGDFADLCHRCASAYEQGKFCDIFHLKASGWRCCESCGKRIHCGCIVSASAFTLLNAGGIECLACARKKVSLGPNFSPPPSVFFQSPIAEKFRDLSINWNSSTGSNQISCRPPSFVGPSGLQFDIHNRGDSYEFGQPTTKERATACSVEKTRGMNHLMGKLMSESSNSHTSDILNYRNAGPNCNLYHPLISLKEGPCGVQLAFPVPLTTPIEKNGHLRLDGSNSWHTPNSSPLSCLYNDLNCRADSLFKSKSRDVRTHLDTSGKYQVVPRYWPKVSYEDRVLQYLSKEVLVLLLFVFFLSLDVNNSMLGCRIGWISESVVTPLFEKRLSASDTGRVGRLVLPKKCAENFLPQIFHTEGVPLKVQDSMGKDWTFQFRFWPNNHSRIYVLEGVTPCLQSLQLQAGDTVIFSRVDPEGKLIMGFRKASVAQSSDQETDSTYNNRDSCTNRDQAEPVDMHSPSKMKKSAYTAKETSGVEFASGKNISSMMITRSKRQKVEKGDHDELKLTWEEAQGFILPPPNVTPSIMKIEGFEFEEYEDAPVIGKPTTGIQITYTGTIHGQKAFCMLPDIENFSSTCSCNKRHLAEEHDEEAMEDETEGLSMSPKATTKHPRHRNGCTCIVCIQSPSGKSPKHDKCCSCTVCDTVKRRICSLLLGKKKKKQIEKGNKALKELESLNSDEELHQSDNNSGDTSKSHEHHGSPLKPQIDLNFQPEKDEESLPRSHTTINNKSLHHDDTSFKPPSSSSAHSQIEKEDEGKP